GTSPCYVRTIGCTGGRSEYEHRVVARDVLGGEVSRAFHTHHRDEDSLNNDPANLGMVTRSAHGSQHLRTLLENQRRIAEDRRGRSLEDVYGEEKAAEWKENLSRARRRAKDEEELREERTVYAIPNHRVVKVEPAGMAGEVYDVSLPHLHNFAANGVFVHNCDHPDVEEFITCKNDNDQINNFNISVAITDAFMEAVEADADFELKNPRNDEVVKTVRARDLFRRVVEGAWLNGEPGVVFIDKINADNPTPQFPIESTNPCSEAHLPPYDSCNLGSINLERFVLTGAEVRRRLSLNGSADDAPPRADGRTPRVDWMALRETVRTAVRFLDDVIEANRYPLPRIEEMSKGNRRIGLGVMGFADALVKLEIPYDSPKALKLAESLMEWIDRYAWEASRELADERGVFANYWGSRHEDRGDRVRNATVTTIAPTGTISMIAGCSGGIEPLFAVAFMRRQADMEMPDVNPEFVKLAKERGFYSEELIEDIARSGGVRDVAGVPEDVKRVWATSQEISPEFHVRMQAAFQKHTSMGISKTVNLPREATVEDVEDAYRLAYATGCKGIAVYRDGSRDAQVLSTGKTEKKPTEVPPPAPAAHAPARPTSLAEARNGRPRTLQGVTKKLMTGHGPLYVSMNDDEFGPRETFVLLGKPGGTAAAFSDALGRTISLAEKHGASPAEIVAQLRGIQDGHPAGVGPNAVLSVPDGVARAMAEHYLHATPQKASEPSLLPIAGPCPDCGAGLAHEEGCQKCYSCGYSRCS
ncbi:MAG: adenosylcobalamin-dependent ribonucleoside-diphosphate reductase, partial [Actinomycetota bacterium]|nr:adenosylcobalamin-dependent ribonucleoside-diphosphate reductase [Actinomycetota bacterium]